MTNIFAVVGENKDNPDLLLVVGADGYHYQYQVAEGITAPVELNDDWTIDPCPPSLEDMLG